MTRIIGGTARGRRLATPPGEATRPTSDRVREALFSAIESWAGTWAGLRVLDLFAGSGAVGLEAYSRGAEAVTFVERDRRTAGLIAANARVVGLDRPDVVAAAATTALGRPPVASYDVVFLDPPYPMSEDEVARTLELLASGWLAPDALVVVERSSRSPEPRWPSGLKRDKQKKYGETTLWFALATLPPCAAPSAPVRSTP